MSTCAFGSGILPKLWMRHFMMFFRIRWFSYGLWSGETGELKLIKWLKKDGNILPNAETRHFGSIIHISIFLHFHSDEKIPLLWQVGRTASCLWPLSSPAATGSWPSLEQSCTFFGSVFSPETWLEEFGKIMIFGLLGKRNVVSDSLKWLGFFFFQNLHETKTPQSKMTFSHIFPALAAKLNHALQIQNDRLDLQTEHFSLCPHQNGWLFITALLLGPFLLLLF